MVNKGKTKQSKKSEKKDEEASDELSDDLPMFYDRGSGGTICDKILLNNKLRVGIAMFVVAVVLPVLVYAYVFDVEEKDDLSNILGTCILHPEYRVPCLVGRRNVTSGACGDIGCCWNETTAECHHSIPTKYDYLIDTAATSNDTWIPLTPRTETTPFLTPALANLNCVLLPVTESHLQITIQNDARYPAVQNSSLHINDTSFNATVYETGFSVEVWRRLGVNDTGNGTLLLSTSRGPLIASDNYWELTLQLSRDSIVYGLGGMRLTGHMVDPVTLYSRSNVTEALPFIMAMDKHGQGHGIYLENTGPLEIQFMNDSNLFILRSLSNEGFNIHIFAGPTPKDVLSQLTDLLGRPKMPAYWALGLHICRDAVTDIVDVATIVEEYRQFRDGATAIGLPYDSHCLHEKLLNDLTLSVDAQQDLEAVIAALELLENDGKKFVVTLPVPIAVGTSDAYLSAVSEDLLVQQAVGDSSLYEGRYGGKTVVYPDWTRPASGGWMRQQMQALQDSFGDSHPIAGVVLQENWPANQKQHGKSEELVYIPPAFNGSLSNGTLWWQSVHDTNVTHSDIHNTYGLLHSHAVHSSLNASNALLLSSSTYPGSGQLGGSHQQSKTQVPAKWVSLKDTLSSVLGLGLAGVPLASGGPVCGSMADFKHSLHDALCLKWYLLSITLPLIRTSSIPPYRDPTSIPSGFSRNAVLQALRLRYALLPYYYTVFNDASRTGTPVARPLFFEFPDDALTRYVDELFMVGEALLVAPVLVPDSINVDVYLPRGDVTWYQLIGGYPINNGTGGHIVIISTLETEVTILLRGGYIVPTQKAGLTSGLSRKNPYHLLAGLQCSQDDACEAEGLVYLDQDSEFTNVHFRANRTSLTIENLQSAQFLCSADGAISTVIDEISVYGLHSVAFSRSGTGRAELAEFSNNEWALNKKNLGIDWCQIDDRDSITINYDE